MAKPAEAPKASDMLAAFVKEGKKRLGDDRSMVASEAMEARQGLPLDNIPLMYLFNANILPMGIIIGVAGESKSMKSTLLYWMEGLFIKNGGFAQYVETENKYNPIYKESVIGSEGMGMVNVDEVETVEEAQGSVTASLQTYDEKCPDKSIPLIIGVDSLAGTATDSVVENIDKKGFAEKSYAEAANLWSMYLKKLSADLRNRPVVFVITNHLKEKIDSNRSAFMPKAWSKQGGSAQDFHSTYYLYMSKIGEVKTGEHDGRVIRIKTHKCGLGPEGRQIDVPVLWQYAPNADGEYIQTTVWDWDAALARMLVDEKHVERPVRDLLKVKCTSNRYSCETLGLKDVTDTELGAAIHARPDLVEELRKRMGARKWNVFQAKQELEAEAPKAKPKKKAPPPTPPPVPKEDPKTAKPVIDLFGDIPLPGEEANEAQ